MNPAKQRKLDAIKTETLDYVLTDSTDPDQKEIHEWLLQNSAYLTHIAFPSGVTLHMTFAPGSPTANSVLSHICKEHGINPDDIKVQGIS